MSAGIQTDELLRIRITEFGRTQVATNQPCHSSDYASVHWFGADYTFTSKQADAVSEWWAAWQNGTPALHDDTVLAELESNARGKPHALRDLFKGHPAWDTMIVRGPRQGTHQLQE